MPRESVGLMLFVGVDTGGTFTDLVAMDEAGVLTTAKVATTPGELERGVLEGLALIATACGVTPQAQNTGTSPSSKATGSPKSGLLTSVIPMASGLPMCTGAPCTAGKRDVT